MIDPRHLTMQQWADAVNLTLASSGPTTKLQGSDWGNWAYDTIALPQVAIFSPPSPRGFARWDEWAQRFVECVPL